MHLPLTIDHPAVADLKALPLSGFAKGYPTDLSGVVGDLVGLAVDQLPTPSMVLLGDQVEHNVATMAEYCTERGAWLAPHAKTTMAPALVARQVAAGAWAMTVATPDQVAILRRFGVNRILLANQLINPIGVRWLADELATHLDFEFFCLVDSTAGVDILQTLPSGRVNVLIELGHPAGRSGARSIDEVVALADAVRRSNQKLVGVEGYEGLLGNPNVVEDVGRVDRYLEMLVRAADRIRPLGNGAGPWLVSAGGSAFFDRVAEHLANTPDTRLVLRSGCYVTHDAGWYEMVSPLGVHAAGPLRLRNAIEIHATITSRPERDFATADAGKRDLGFDLGLPIVLGRVGPDGRRSALDPQPVVSGLSDQHAHLEHAGAVEIGDRVAFGGSHPCAMFDRWRLIPIIDGSDRVVDVAVTFF